MTKRKPTMKAWVCRNDDSCSDYIVFLRLLAPGTGTNVDEWPMSADTTWCSVEPDIWEHISSIRLEPGDGPVELEPGSLKAKE